MALKKTDALKPLNSKTDISKSDISKRKKLGAQNKLSKNMSEADHSNLSLAATPTKMEALLKSSSNQQKNINKNSKKPIKNAGVLAKKQTNFILKSLENLSEHIGIIHGVLEEICERQEALASWQMEFSKRLLTMGDLQWRTLSDILKTDLGDPVGAVYGAPASNAEDLQKSKEEEFDQLTEDITELFDEMRLKREKRQIHFSKREALTQFESNEESSDQPPTDDEPLLFISHKSEFH